MNFLLNSHTLILKYFLMETQTYIKVEITAC